MKTIKVLDICDYVHLVCIKDLTTNCNPYRLYLVYRSLDKYGYPANHKKQLAAYQDFASVICHVKDLYLSGIQYRPIDDILTWNRQYYRPYTGK